MDNSSTTAASALPENLLRTEKSVEDVRPWVEKYRPVSLDDVVAHEEILATLRRLMTANSLPHLLFYGPPGTGKTSTIQACARFLFGSDSTGNVLELNASDDRGIDVVRNEIKEFASTSMVFQKVAAKHSFKLIVLDEADQMSGEAQAALRRVIEKYTKNVRFCILCNHVNKIIPAIQSRCTRFRFAPVKKSRMAPRLGLILTTEKVKFTEEGISAAYKLCGGDLRRCLNMLQATALSFGSVTEDTVYSSTGNPTPQDIRAFVEISLGCDFAKAWAQINQLLLAKGASMADVVKDVAALIMQMDLPQDSKIFIISKLSDVEYYLAVGTQESTALASTLGALQIVREATTSGKDVFIHSGQVEE